MRKTELLDNLKTCFNGDPWHGNSLCRQLENLEPETALFRMSPGNHNIVEIIRHITLWREFALQKLKGNIGFNLKFDTQEEWPVVNYCTREDLIQVILTLNENQKWLIHEIEKFDESSYKEIVPGRNYNFIYLLSGIIYHDTYHSGQIGLIRSVYNKL